MVFEAWKERANELEGEVYALYLAFRDDRTPLTAKVVVGLVIAYAASPIDPLPVFIPPLGYVDELVVLPVGVMIAVWLIPDDVMNKSRKRAGEEINIGQARWVVAGIVVLTWILIGMLAIRVFIN